MRRIILVLTVTAIMAAMLVASAMPAFAAGKSENAPNCAQGQITATFHQKTMEDAFKHFDKALYQCGNLE